MKKLITFLVLALITMSVNAQTYIAKEGIIYFISEEGDTLSLAMANDSVWFSEPEPDTLEAYFLISDLNQCTRTPLRKYEKIHYVDMMEGYIVDHNDLSPYEILDWNKDPIREDIIIWDWRLKPE